MPHTPGPWKYGARTSRIGVLYGDTQGLLCREVSGGGWWIAQVNPLALTHSKTKTDAEWLEEGEANARLIAAAPDLLAACKAIRDTPLTPGGRLVVTGPRIHLLLAAIAKAEGK